MSSCIISFEEVLSHARCFQQGCGFIEWTSLHAKRQPKNLESFAKKLVEACNIHEIWQKTQLGRLGGFSKQVVLVNTKSRLSLSKKFAYLYAGFRKRKPL